MPTTSPRNVLVIAYYFPPMGLSGVQRTLKFVKYLPKFGWQPTVLTVTPTGYFAQDYTLLEEIHPLRNKYKDKFEKEHGVKLGFMSFFVKAAVAALKRYPVLNASVDGTDIVYHGYFDIGIAVGSPRGLVVPILRDADQLSMAWYGRLAAKMAPRWHAFAAGRKRRSQK